MSNIGAISKDGEKAKNMLYNMFCIFNHLKLYYCENDQRGQVENRDSILQDM